MAAKGNQREASVVQQNNFERLLSKQTGFTCSFTSFLAKGYNRFRLVLNHVLSLPRTYISPRLLGWLNESASHPFVYFNRQVDV